MADARSCEIRANAGKLRGVTNIIISSLRGMLHDLCASMRLRRDGDVDGG